LFKHLNFSDGLLEKQIIFEGSFKVIDEVSETLDSPSSAVEIFLQTIARGMTTTRYG